MAKHIIYKWHRNDSTGMINNIGEANPTRIIEKGQRAMKAQGFSDAITWQLHEGDIVSAMVASSKL